jgi:hypothetical protein
VAANVRSYEDGSHEETLDFHRYCVYSIGCWFSSVLLAGDETMVDKTDRQKLAETVRECLLPNAEQIVDEEALSTEKREALAALAVLAQPCQECETLRGEDMRLRDLLNDALDRAESAERQLEQARAALLQVDDALVNGDAPEVADWHRQHAEASAEDCLVCIIRAVLKGNTTADIEGD